MQMLRTSLALLMLALMVTACETTGEDDIETWKPTPLTQPAWVKTGKHGNYKSPTHLFVMRTAKGDRAPSTAALVDDLCRDLHQAMSDALSSELGSTPLGDAMRSGRWVSPNNLPVAKLKSDQWSDGQESASFIALKLADLQAHNEALMPGFGDPQAGPRSAVEEARREENLDSAIARFRRRTANAERDISLLSALVLANALQWYGKDAEITLPPPLIARAQASMDTLVSFTQLFRVVESSGANQRLELASMPTQDIEIVLREGGEPAVGLPVKPVVGGLEAADYTPETDRAGACALSLAGPVRYTGQARQKVGFALDPDPLTQGLKLGAQIQPWLVWVITPTAENSVVLISLIEKIDNINREGEEALITQRLRSWIEEAGLRVISSEAEAEEGEFIFDLTGVISVTERQQSARSERRRYVAEGTVSLRMLRGPIVARTKLFGTSEFFGEDSTRAARAAQENLWQKDAEYLRAEFNAAFPPIFPPPTPAERSGQ